MLFEARAKRPRATAPPKTMGLHIDYYLAALRLTVRGMAAPICKRGRFFLRARLNFHYAV